MPSVPSQEYWIKRAEDVLVAGEKSEVQYEKELTAAYKTTLQEVVQQNPDENVNYVIVGESGPDHTKTFEVEVHLNSNVIGKGKGSSKKSAEQAAAKEALKLMGVI